MNTQEVYRVAKKQAEEFARENGRNITIIIIDETPYEEEMRVVVNWSALGDRTTEQAREFADTLFKACSRADSIQNMIKEELQKVSE